MAIQLNTDGLTGSIEIGPCNEDGWRDCLVSVRALGFSAEYSCDVRDEELRWFCNELEAAIHNLGQDYTNCFRTLERCIELILKLDSRGHVEGTYAFARDWRGPCLSGSFSADQTHLVGWAKELQAIFRGGR